jgi:DNA-binding IclR family transcriptional regulator
LRAKEMVFLDGVESTKPLRAANRTGTSLPAHTTAGGKALLANLPDGALRNLYPEHRLVRGTPKSCKTRKALFDELLTVRERGYAHNDGESEPELAAYATAIRGRSGHANVAIVVSGPAARIVAAGKRQIIPALGRVASALAAAMI